MKRLILLSLILVSAIGSNAFAKEYVNGKLGVYFPDESAFDDGFNIEAAYGRDFTDFFPETVRQNPWLKNVTLEAGIGYYTADFSETISGFGLVPDTKVKGDLSVVPLTLTGIYNYPLSGTNFNFFGGGGVGLYFSDSEVRMDGSKEDDSSVDLGLRFAGGGEYLLSPQFSLGAELRFDVVSDDIGGVFVNFLGKYRF